MWLHLTRCEMVLSRQLLTHVIARMTATIFLRITCVCVSVFDTFDITAQQQRCLQSTQRRCRHHLPLLIQLWRHLRVCFVYCFSFGTKSVSKENTVKSTDCCFADFLFFCIQFGASARTVQFILVVYLLSAFVANLSLKRKKKSDENQKGKRIA